MKPSLRTGAAAALLAGVTIAPFALGLFSSAAFYFRDLSGHFFPVQVFVLEGLRAGEARYWNPLTHEGEPVTLPPLSYPLDLLGVLRPDEHGLSWLLALHVPLGALGFLALARGLGLSRSAGAAGALVHALGGFSLSCLNLYVYAHAVAWAPLVVLGLRRAASGDGRSVAAGALAVGAALSTTGLEVVLQSLLVGLVLPIQGAAPGRWLRAGAAILLGIGLAAGTLLVVGGLVAGSARGPGFPTEVVLAHSVHPLTLLQVVVAGFYGDPSDLAGRWWGHNFFPMGFPYVLSLYLGALALVLAAVGAAERHPLRRGLLLIALLGLVVSLGRYAGLEPVVEALPWLRKVRFPTKAFFTVQLAVAVLAAMGVQALGTRGAVAWRRLASGTLLVGALLSAAPLLPHLAPGAVAWFVGGFFPPAMTDASRDSHLALLLADASRGGLFALAAGIVALAAAAGRVGAGTARAATLALLAADLVRAGAGLNPMVSTRFFDVAPEMAPWARAFAEGDARVFTCEPELTAAFHQARQSLRGRQDAWTFAVYAATFTPSHNVRAGVATAYGRDRTMLVPEAHVLAPEDAGCRSFEALAGRLRRAGATHVLSVVPITHQDLESIDVVRPRRTAPLPVHVYALRRPLPLRHVARVVRHVPDARAAEAAAAQDGFLEGGGAAVEGAAPDVSDARGRVLSAEVAPGRLVLEVESDRATAVVVREAYARGWTATVDGRPETVRRADGRHLAVPVPAGRSRVALRYRPPGLAVGRLLTAASALACGWLAFAGRRR